MQPARAGAVVSVVIPCLDEAEAIAGVVRDVQDHDFRWERYRRFYVSYFQPIDGITTANFEIRTESNAGVVAGSGWHYRG